MDLQHALKNLIQNGTNIEYFDNGYVIQINKDIKVFKEGKKTLKKLTQTQLNMLLLQARGGIAPKKNVQKASQKQIEDEDFISYEQQEDQVESDDSISEVSEKPLKKQIRKRVEKIQKIPQINNINPQLDLKELIRLRTENSQIKQQHQDAVKKIENYKQKVKRYKQPKQTIEKEQVIEKEEPQIQQEESVQFEQQDKDINFDQY